MLNNQSRIQVGDRIGFAGITFNVIGSSWMYGLTLEHPRLNYTFVIRYELLNLLGAKLYRRQDGGGISVKENEMTDKLIEVKVGNATIRNGNFIRLDNGHDYLVVQDGKGKLNAYCITNNLASWLSDLLCSSGFLIQHNAVVYQGLQHENAALLYKNRPDKWGKATPVNNPSIVDLGNGYKATAEDGMIKVGCTRFDPEKIREALALLDKAG